MEVILDELTPIEFFNHGGIVKVLITDENLINECEVKKKYTFFDNKSYSRFFRSLYVTYIHKHPELNIYDAYKYINSKVNLIPTIGNAEYVVDLKYDNTTTFETAKFYYHGDKMDCEISPKDPYGIKNVCFSLIDTDDIDWDEYAKERIEDGFDRSEVWSLDGTISKFIYPRLKVFKKEVIKDKVFPIGLSLEEWIDILDSMIKGFELLSLDREKTDEEIEFEKETLKLFSRYFFNLYT